MPWLLGSYASLDGEGFTEAARWLDELEVGGIVISIGSPLDAAAKLNALQRRSHLPLIVAADLEYGAAMRMIGATAFPQPMSIGATGRELDAYQLGRITAVEARAVGIHWTFSPVADVNSNPDNPIINTRSFGESPDSVAKLVAAYIRGASDHGLFTTAKHFPGHGDTSTDSHLALPQLKACWDRLNSLELVPFVAAIRAGVTAVMTAHLALPCIQNGSSVPATLSPDIMTGILRDSLGFDGIVITDALTMAAIVNEYGVGESAVRAFLAGSDILLYPTDPFAAAAAMVDAVAQGRITMDRLDQSVRRVLALKEQAGLFRRREVPLDSIPTMVGLEANTRIAKDVAARALTLVQRGEIEKFRDTRGVTSVIVYAEETNLSMGGILTKTLNELNERVVRFRLYPASGPLSYDSARVVIEQNPRVLFAVAVRPISSRGHVALPEPLASLITATDSTKPTMLASFGSPYLLNQLTAFRGTYLLAWHPVSASEEAVARAIAGGAPIAGHLPITLSDRYPIGYGIVIEGN